MIEYKLYDSISERDLKEIIDNVTSDVGYVVIGEKKQGFRYVAIRNDRNDSHTGILFRDTRKFALHNLRSEGWTVYIYIYRDYHNKNFSDEKLSAILKNYQFFHGDPTAPNIEHHFIDGLDGLLIADSDFKKISPAAEIAVLQKRCGMVRAHICVRKDLYDSVFSGERAELLFKSKCAPEAFANGYVIISFSHENDAYEAINDILSMARNKHYTLMTDLQDYREKKATNKMNKINDSLNVLKFTQHHTDPKDEIEKIKNANLNVAIVLFSRATHVWLRLYIRSDVVKMLLAAGVNISDDIAEKIGQYARRRAYDENGMVTGLVKDGGYLTYEFDVDDVPPQAIAWVSKLQARLDELEKNKIDINVIGTNIKDPVRNARSKKVTYSIEQFVSPRGHEFVVTLNDKGR